MIEVATSADIRGGLVVGHDGSPASGPGRTLGAPGSRNASAIPLHVVRTWSLSSAPKPATATRGYVPPMTDFEQAVRDRLEADVAALGLADGCEVTCHVLHGAAGRAAAPGGRARRAARGRVAGRGRLPRPALRVHRRPGGAVRAVPVVVVPVTGADEPRDPDRSSAEDACRAGPRCHRRPLTRRSGGPVPAATAPSTTRWSCPSSGNRSSWPRRPLVPEPAAPRLRRQRAVQGGAEQPSVEASNNTLNL